METNNIDKIRNELRFDSKLYLLKIPSLATSNSFCEPKILPSRDIRLVSFLLIFDE